MTKEEAIIAMKNMKDGERIHIAWAQGGGGVVHMVDGHYILFEVSLYGGESIFSMCSKSAEEIAGEAYSWT